jgi:DNA segregation ATPase FtsK/SpoIIIE-like protein
MGLADSTGGAKSTSMPRVSKTAPLPPTFGDRLREIGGYLVVAAAAFLLIACLSFVDRDSPAALTGLANRCGDAGYVAARTSLYWFGVGTYLALFTLVVWGVALIGGRVLRVGPFRILWLGTFLFSAAALVSDLGLSRSVALPDAGGLVGRSVAEFVRTDLAFGPWGTTLALAVAALISFQLATDFVLLRLVRGALAFARRRQEQASAAIESVGPLFKTLLARREVEAGERAPARRNPAARKGEGVEIAITDADVEGFPAPKGDDAEEGENKPRRRRRRDEPQPAPLDERSPALVGVDPEEVVAAAQAFANDGRAVAANAPAGTDASSPADPAEAESKPRVKRKRKDESTTPAEPTAELAPAADDAPAARSNPALASEPPILDEDPESEVVPPPPIERRPAAKIHLEPPKSRGHRSAGFEKETTVFSAPSIESKKEYQFPALALLEDPTPIPSREFQKMIEGMSVVLEQALNSFKVEAQVVEIQKGPVITMFEINVAEGTRVDRIRALEDDLAIRLKVPSVRIVAPIPGKSTIGIEVPNRIRETVCLRELLSAPEYESGSYAIPIFLGKDAAGRPLIEDLAKMPHLLVAGATGAGKSVCLNAIIMSVLFSRTPDQVKMILIDPKMVELSLFESIPHLACPVVRDMNRAAQILEWACAKMDERYEMMAEVGARNIFAYNKIPDEVKRQKLNVPEDDLDFEAKMPFVVVVVDELADLMMVSAKDVENNITRLAQKSRAVGIHIILATQRPSTNVITGLIKANLPTRISFQVASKIDSRVVLDQNGAEKLLGFGDMLYLPPRTSMLVRGQGAFVADEEIRKTVEFIKVEAPQYSRELMQKGTRADVDPRSVDDLYEEAVRFICETQRGSASLLQRRFAIGYTRASRLIDLMAEDGILGEYRNAQAREVLLTTEEYDERLRSLEDA